VAVHLKICLHVQKGCLKVWPFGSVVKSSYGLPHGTRALGRPEGCKAVCPAWSASIKTLAAELVTCLVDLWVATKTRLRCVMICSVCTSEEEVSTVAKGFAALSGLAIFVQGSRPLTNMNAACDVACMAATACYAWRALSRLFGHSIVSAVIV